MVFLLTIRSETIGLCFVLIAALVVSISIRDGGGGLHSVGHLLRSSSLLWPSSIVFLFDSSGFCLFVCVYDDCPSLLYPEDSSRPLFYMCVLVACETMRTSVKIGHNGYVVRTNRTAWWSKRDFCFWTGCFMVMSGRHFLILLIPNEGTDSYRPLRGIIQKYDTSIQLQLWNRTVFL